MQIYQKPKKKQSLRLNFQIITKICQSLEINSNFIDIYDRKNNRGLRQIDQGRIIIQLSASTHQDFKYIIIDKDHYTRFLVKQIHNGCQKESGHNFEKFHHFSGFKMELNKYMIYGTFINFQVKSYQLWFGFTKRQQSIILFCERKNINKIQTHYFNQQIQIMEYDKKDYQNIYSSQGNQAEYHGIDPFRQQYFRTNMHQNTIQDIKNENKHISFKIIQLFFKKLLYFDFSQMWFGSQKQFKPTKLINYALIESYLKNKNLITDIATDRYYLINQYNNALQSKKIENGYIIFVPIYQNYHFLINIIVHDKIQTKKIIYQFDPFNKHSQHKQICDNFILIVKEIIAKSQNQQKTIDFDQMFIIQNDLQKLKFPLQLKQTNDCAFCVCFYALLIMILHKCFKKIYIKSLQLEKYDEEKIAKLIKRLRDYIYNSIMYRKSFSDIFQKLFDIKTNQTL